MGEQSEEPNTERECISRRRFIGELKASLGASLNILP